MAQQYGSIKYTTPARSTSHKLLWTGKIAVGLHDCICDVLIAVRMLRLLQITVVTWQRYRACPKARQKLIILAFALKAPPNWNTNTMYAMAPRMARS